MKRKLPLSFILLICGLILFLPPKLTENNTADWAIQLDALNPFIKTKEVYARIPEKPLTSLRDPKHGIDYIYLADTFDQQGRKRKVQVKSYGRERLAPLGHYLKLKIKGQAVYAYEAVMFDQIPKPALQNLRVATK